MKRKSNFLWNRIDRSAGSNGCWPWLGGLDRYGYGTVSRVRGSRAHKAVWIELNGSVPKGLCVCHSCDNPACCNLKHLWLGTHKQNMEDRNKKSRQSKGITQPGAILTEKDVRFIRNAYAKGLLDGIQLALRFGISSSHIYEIVHRKSWKHVK